MTLYNFESNILYTFFKVMQEYENCEDGLIYVEGDVNIPPLEGKRRYFPSPFNLGELLTGLRHTKCTASSWLSWHAHLWSPAPVLWASPRLSTFGLWLRPRSGLRQQPAPSSTVCMRMQEGTADDCSSHLQVFQPRSWLPVEQDKPSSPHGALCELLTHRVHCPINGFLYHWPLR